MKKLFRAAIATGFATMSSIAVAQAPPVAPPVPKLPAMPSLEQKGSDDMTRPAGAAAGKSAQEPKHAGKETKKHEPEPPAAKPPPAQPKGSSAKHEKVPAKPAKVTEVAKVPVDKRKATARPAVAKRAAKPAAKAPKTHKSAPARRPEKGR